MKTILLAGLLSAGCVQPTHDHFVSFRLLLPAAAPGRSVALRGSDAPLSWDADHLLRPLPGDTVYETAVSFRSGYRFTEVKFVVDGRYELAGAPNRRVSWGDADSIRYEARFNDTVARSTLHP